MFVRMVRTGTDRDGSKDPRYKCADVIESCKYTYPQSIVDVLHTGREKGPFATCHSGTWIKKKQGLFDRPKAFRKSNGHSPI